MLILTWKDPRLAWTINADNCASSIDARASLDAESTEIWVPNYDVTNRVTSVKEMGEASASIYSDGTVRWIRQGPLKVLCHFTGLASFPYDTLGCQMALQPIGSQIDMNANYIQRNLSFGNYMQSSFKEYSVITERCSFGQVSDPVGWVLYYNFYFARAQTFYETNIIYPTILLTYLSFFAFFLDLRIGERVSYGVALTLVIVAQQIIASDRIPISQKKLWMDQLVFYSFFWNIFVVIESVMLASIYFWREDVGKSEEGEKKKNVEEVGESYSEYDVDDYLDNENNGIEEKEIKKTSNFRKAFRAKLGVRRFLLSYPMRNFDVIAAIFCFVSYSCFLITMYATNSHWSDNDNSFTFPRRSTQDEL